MMYRQVESCLDGAFRDSTHDTDVFAAQLRERHARRITGQLTIPARQGCFAPLPPDLDQRLASALKARGISRLYTHQAAAWRRVLAGEHTTVVTPTASGKTLCYNLPVLQSALADHAKSLYLFPTKALAQDQLAELNELNRAAALGIRAFTFDGDTPGDARKAVRTRGDIVVTNPDMLHQGILPHHTKWAKFFEGLRYVVIDEMHIYRGVFGSHVANVIRRLQRICTFYGTDPQFILCSATIANPAELASGLIHRQVTTITECGAPQGARHLLLWNPPVVNHDLGIRASARSQTTHIAKWAVNQGLKSIVFAQSRLLVEVLTKYLKDAFDHDPRYPARIAAYRGGYLPTERRTMERRLREGEIDCVVSTSALELGMDIGSLDLAILNGYPGTIAGTWQRLGRAGRRQRSAIGVLVASSMPLDQYIIRNPEFFLGASPEQARIDPNQLLILLDHIRCAAFELPFKEGESFGNQDLLEMLGYLEEHGILHREGQQWHWMAESYPANSVTLRSVAEGNFVVIDTTNGQKQIIAEVDYNSAPMTLYEGAIYMIQSIPYQVETLDWEGRKAYVSQTRADYYTDAIDYTRLKILESFEKDQRDRFSISQGEVHLVTRVAGYKKIRYYTHENIGYGKIDLPDQEMHTTAVWWQINPKALDDAFESRQAALEGFLGAGYAMHIIATMRMLSDAQDIGRAIGDGDARWYATVEFSGHGRLNDDTGRTLDPSELQRFTPTLFLYDNYPGGIGITSSLYHNRSVIVSDAHQLIESCECAHGCPGCIGPILASEEDLKATPKQSALLVLSLLSSHEP
jgi:DEAD/DEAH box helicase domain-containing protein